MKSYTATEEDMQVYSRIVSALTQLDMQRQEYMQQLAQWPLESLAEMIKSPESEITFGTFYIHFQI